MKTKTLAVLLPVVLLFSSCAGWRPNKATTGGLGGAAVGAIAGGAIGGNAEATLLGAAVGGMLGYIVGNEMDKYDRQRLNQVYETQPSGRSTAWVNPDTGNHYTVTPEPAFTNPSTGQVCRDAVINAVIDGKEQQVHTTACRGADGRWHVQGQ